ncbi:MAG: metallophosphoesterase [Magnetococcales bacterium]|nr:metallophosphoesterase [Magnetococcales bacterium]
MKTIGELVKKLDMISGIKRVAERCRKKQELLLVGERHIRGSCIRIPCSGAVVEICLGGPDGKILHLQPEIPLTIGEEKQWPTYWLVDMARMTSGHGSFLRLKPKQNLVLGRHSVEQTALFDYSTRISSRHLMILHEGENLQLSDLASNGGTCLRLLPDPPPSLCLATWHQQQRQRLAELFFEGVAVPDDGSITQPLAAPVAMERLQRAHAVLRTAFLPVNCCPPSSTPDPQESSAKGESRAVVSASDHDTDADEEDVAGDTGTAAASPLIHLPVDTLPIVVGDLHAKVDNLLTLLITGGVLAALENGAATLVFLGDAVHPDEVGQYAEMQGSMLIMDIILTLMAHFPGKVLYLRGNHDGFSEEIHKGSVSQGRVWQRVLTETRGKAYRVAMKAFYQDLPYMVVHPHLVATHAAPPVIKISLELLADMRQHPQLIHQVSWNRMHQPRWPSGYREKDIKNLRNVLELGKDVPFVVGHTPMDHEHTAWLHAGEMAHHHIVYSGTLDRVGWLVCLSGGVIHTECPVVHQPGMVV